ncbi:MAG: hypothetical protein GY795_12845 [Desulfobacterales bacterium]|nr:hypothetical protein [Desulfobacterales bacterium]
MNTKTEHTDALVKRSLRIIRALRTRLEQKEKKFEPIAITGMACRFPGGCATPDKFWNFLKKGGDGVREIPLERWNADDFYDPDSETPGTMYVREAGFLEEDVTAFDARFFGISPREAAETDPQQRLILEVAWEALENACQDIDRLKGSRTGIFVGIIGAEYPLMPRKTRRISPYLATGSALNMASGRIAHILGLHGPAISVDTACSSSLVSVHLACESLRKKESDTALAGGVSLMFSPHTFTALCSMGALSRDGRCKTFDADGDGYGRGEGCGMVVLKRLSSARRDRDPVLAVIRGSAVNHDGPSGGLTVPNGRAQETLLRNALENADILPGQVGYLETHGTGTSLGDPIETHAITEVFGKDRSNDNSLVLGAVKANIGHLEAAAGIAGLIKAVLCIRNKEIPPQLHINRINPKISPEKIPAVIPISLMNWNSNGKPGVAGVSSFGFSGTNAHVIISEPDDQDSEFRIQNSVFRPLHIMTISAKHDDALKELAERYKNLLNDHPDSYLADICYTANSARTHFSCRAAFIAGNAEQMKEHLDNFAAGNRHSEESGDQNGFFYGKIREGDVSVVTVLFSSDSDHTAGYVKKEHLDLPLSDSPGPWKTLLRTLCQFYCAGANIDWQGFYKGYLLRKVILPTYPFQRRQHRIESLPFSYSGNIPATPGAEKNNEDLPDPLNGKQTGDLPGDIRFEYCLSADRLPEIKDNSGVLHVGYYHEMLCRAVKAIYNTTVYKVKEIEFLIALYMPDGVARTVHLELTPCENNRVDFRFYSRDSIQRFRIMNARGSLYLNDSVLSDLSAGVSSERITAIKKQCTKQMKGAEFYEIMMAQRGMQIGHSIRWIVNVWYREGESLALFRKAQGSEKDTKYTLGRHPGIWDACAQLFFPAFSEKIPSDMKFMMVKWEDFVSVPRAEEGRIHNLGEPLEIPPLRGARGVFYEGMTVCQNTSNTPLTPLKGGIPQLINAPAEDEELWCHAEIWENPGKDGMIMGKFSLYDRQGCTLAQTGECRMNAVREEMFGRITTPKEHSSEDKELSEKLKICSEKDRHGILEDYLRRKTAMILDMPLSELDTEESLSNLGMDSIVGLEIRTAIENALNIDMPIELIIMGPSLSELTDKALCLLNGETSPGTEISYTSDYKKDRELWFSYRKKHPDPGIRLFCFPYGTKGASLFRRWQEKLAVDNSTEVCPVQLPGRENRLKEMPPNNIGEMTDILEQVLKPELDRPYAFYGHSAGALIAFQLAYRLWQTSEIRPAHLFAGGFTSPVIPNPLLHKKLAEMKAAGFRGIPDQIDEASTVLLTQIMRLDDDMHTDDMEGMKRSMTFLKMLESYYRHQKEEEPFDIPVTVFHGKNDQFVSMKDSEAWKPLTTGPFRLHILAGDHFFLHEDQSQEKLLELIAGNLAKYID